MTTTILEPVSQYDHRFGAETKDVATFLSRWFITCCPKYQGSTWPTSPTANILGIDKHLMPPLFRNTELPLFFRNALHPDVSLLLVGMSWSVSEALTYSPSPEPCARVLGAGCTVCAQVSSPHFVNMLSYYIDWLTVGKKNNI